MVVGARCFSNNNKNLRTVQQEDGVSPLEARLQFSKAPIMQDYGELPFGEIPEPLKYSRPFHESTLSNGVKVTSERIAGATAHVAVYVRAGSRHEDLATTGSSYLLSNLLSRGTSNRSKTEFAQEVDNMGAVYNSKADREWTRYSLQTFRGDASRAVALLGDVISNSTFNSAELELVKEEVSREHEANHTRYHETMVENIHFNSFRDHMIGQPVKGDRDLTSSLGIDHVRNFHANNYFGENIVIVATGDVDHTEIAEAAEQAFASLPQTVATPIANSNRPIYHPMLMMIRDDEMVNTNVGVFYDAPSARHEDYWAFRLFQRMIGDYRIDLHSEHINDPQKQYNVMHTLLAEYPDVTRADCHYFAYSDCGLWGNYLYGNEVFTRGMNWSATHVPTVYGHYVTEVEVVRARNRMYNEMLTTESAQSLNDDIGNQLMTIGRRVPRSEVAARIAHLDNYHMKQLANTWFYDAEPCWTNWGPIEQVSVVGSYKYFKVNTMLTVTSAHNSLHD